MDPSNSNSRRIAPGKSSSWVRASLPARAPSTCFAGPRTSSRLVRVAHFVRQLRLTPRPGELASRRVENAAKLAGGHPRATGIALDVTNDDAIADAVAQHDLVIRCATWTQLVVHSTLID